MYINCTCYHLKTKLHSLKLACETIEWTAVDYIYLSTHVPYAWRLQLLSIEYKSTQICAIYYRIFFQLICYPCQCMRYYLRVVLYIHTYIYTYIHTYIHNYFVWYLSVKSKRLTWQKNLNFKYWKGITHVYN